MDEDCVRNLTDVEKLTKFSISNALDQWLQLCDCRVLTQFDRYSSITTWSAQDVEKCLNEIAELILCQSGLVSQEFVHLFGTILIELLDRASQCEIDAGIKHQLMCVLLGKLVTQNKTVLQ